MFILLKEMFMEGRRIPPGQKPIREFPLLSDGEIPRIDLSKWDLTVEGLVRNKLRLTWDELLVLPFISVTSDFHCVTGWSRLDNQWTGVRFVTIAKMADPLPDAKSVYMTADDGYTTSVFLRDLMEDDALLAYKFEDRPLDLNHGGPLRLVIPRKYAYKSIKWIRRIDFMAEQKVGYWEGRGYSDAADPWKEERYSSH